MLEFKYSFVDGAFLEIKDDNIRNSNVNFFVEFINNSTGKVEYKSNLKPNHWCKTNKKYFVDWTIKVSANQKILFEKKIDLQEDNVLVRFDSKSVGDNIGWMPYVELFRRKHKIKKLYCSTFFNDFFEGNYPNIEFVEPDNYGVDFKYIYTIGYFDDGNNLDRNVSNPYSVPLQKIASDILGLDFKEIHSPIFREKKSVRKIQQKYVCIAEHSTAQCKYWNNPNGWSEVVSYLKSIGYLVYSLSKEDTTLEGVLKPSDFSLEEAISMLEHCEFFIGLSSGLSWVAWGLKVKVILISGFTEPWMEFNEGCVRLHNDEVCNGCWNHPSKYGSFDKNDWLWCPIHKNTFNQFICSKSITSKDVIESINKLDNEFFYNELEKLPEEQEQVKFSKKSNQHYIKIDSRSLGDTIAWVPYAEEYRKKYNVEVYISTYWNHIFIKSFPNLKFILPEDFFNYSFDKKYLIAYYPLNINDEDLKLWDNYPMIDYRNIPLQLIAPNALGLPLVEIDGKVDIPDKPRNISGRYVVIALQSTAQAKYWNNPIGWERVFDYLSKNGYKVVIIDRYKSFGVEGFFNSAPKVRDLVDKTGNIELADRITDIKYADMVITISSGLAWLSWAVGTPVIMISGFTKPWNEFKKNIKRIHNDKVCNGCWNDSTVALDSKNWLWCPHKKSFECSGTIQPIEVIKAIKEIEIEKNSISTPISKGELVDKVTILDIKIQNIKETNKLSNIRKEYNELYDKMMLLGITKQSEEYKELLLVNKKLWKIEDNIRDKERKKQFDDKFIELARSVYFINDERSEIKRKINIKYNSSIVEEKSYQKYK